jgi:hypothetical protein
MKTIAHPIRNAILCLTLAVAGGVAITASNAGDSQASGIDSAARSLVKEVAAKLTESKTIRLTAKHELDPRLGVGSKLEKGPLSVTMARPNRFYAIQKAGTETREIAYDGKTLSLMQPMLKQHALESVRASSIEGFADVMDDRFGFRPPIAELLASDFESTIFRHVTSASVMDGGSIWFTRCDRLHMEQPGMTLDLWVGTKDRLPRRMLLTFTDEPGNPTWDIHLKKWELGATVDETLFSKRPSADSIKVTMVKSR